MAVVRFKHRYVRNTTSSISHNSTSFLTVRPVFKLRAGYESLLPQLRVRVCSRPLVCTAAPGCGYSVSPHLHGPISATPVLHFLWGHFGKAGNPNTRPPGPRGPHRADLLLSCPTQCPHLKFRHPPSSLSSLCWVKAFSVFRWDLRNAPYFPSFPLSHSAPFSEPLYQVLTQVKKYYGPYFPSCPVSKILYTRKLTGSHVPQSWGRSQNVQGGRRDTQRLGRQRLLVFEVGVY